MAMASHGSLMVLRSSLVVQPAALIVEVGLKNALVANTSRLALLRIRV